MERGEIAAADHGTASTSFLLLVFVGDKMTKKEKEKKEGGQKSPVERQTGRLWDQCVCGQQGMSRAVRRGLWIGFKSKVNLLSYRLQPDVRGSSFYKQRGPPALTSGA